jgi:hypothetical protein
VYYLPNNEHKIETARSECAEGITEKMSEFRRLYDSENCEKLIGDGLVKVGNINDGSNRIYLDSDEYKQKAECKKYRDNMKYSSEMYDHIFKVCLREKGLAN